MKSSICVAVFVVVCLVPTVCLAEGATLVPSGSVPRLDGTLAEGEWDDALRIPLNDTAYILLKHSDGFLYLGIQATAMGVGSPLIVRDNEVLALHASAALGTAIYAREDSTWTLRQDFVWQCRSTGFSTNAQNERARFLEENRWLGTIGYLGEPTQCEYQIAWGSEPLAFLFLFADFTDTIHLLSWPIPPADAMEYASVITSSPTPPYIELTFEDWATLEREEE